MVQQTQRTPPCWIQNIIILNPLKSKSSSGASKITAAANLMSWCTREVVHVLKSEARDHYQEIMCLHLWMSQLVSTHYRCPVYVDAVTVRLPQSEFLHRNTKSFKAGHFVNRAEGKFNPIKDVNQSIESWWTQIHHFDKQELDKNGGSPHSHQAQADVFGFNQESTCWFWNAATYLACDRSQTRHLNWPNHP